MAKHGIWFGIAEDFEWDTALIEVDDRKRYGESRLVAAGLMGQCLNVRTFTLGGNTVRIIGLRKANQREVASYVGRT